MESREKPMQNDCNDIHDKARLKRNFRGKSMLNNCNDIHDKARLKSNCREKSWKVDAEIIATTYTTEHDLKAIVVKSRCLY